MIPLFLRTPTSLVEKSIDASAVSPSAAGKAVVDGLRKNRKRGRTDCQSTSLYEQGGRLAPQCSVFSLFFWFNHFGFIHVDDE